MRRRILSLILAAALLLCLIPPQQASAAYENTYKLTGNQRKDILGVALTQMGYTEGPRYGNPCGNDTKYGTWYGYPYQPWCAMFVSWCARQADISKDILANSAKAGPQAQNFDIAWYPGTEYTPVPGDLFFKPDFSHVGLVYEVKGDTVITIEGNVNYEDDENDGFTVCFRERKISESCFGVPEYEGCDTCPSTGGEHKYVYGHNDSHPHANYFYCTACGDTYYTGGKSHVTSCSSCLSCGCTTDYAGLYKVTGVEQYLNLRSGHGGGYPMRDIAELGLTVEVVAGNGKWAHVTHGPYTYYASMAYLTRYVPKPGSVKSDAEVYHEGDTAKITWGSSKTATAYQIKVLRDGTQILSTDVGSERSYSLSALQPGDYEVYITASCADAVSEAGKCSFKVLELYDITYDGRDGTNVPEAQQKVEGTKLTLSDTVPEKEGYIFLGWSDDAAANYSTWQPGDSWTADKDTTLYAIWQSESAVAESLQIATPAKKTVYLIDDELDTTGLVLMLSYSDGTAKRITEGYETSGFRSDIEAELTVTVSYDGLSAGYQVKVLEYLPGDIDMNLTVNKEDVMQLLWHISFPDMFPVEVPADFTGDGIVDKDDVMQLLWHISFPDMFPLM